jgi:hypothetical protein
MSTIRTSDAYKLTMEVIVDQGYHSYVVVDGMAFSPGACGR